MVRARKSLWDFEESYCCCPKGIGVFGVVLPQIIPWGLWLWCPEGTCIDRREHWGCGPVCCYLGWPLQRAEQGLWSPPACGERKHSGLAIMKPWGQWKPGVWWGGQAEGHCPWARTRMWKHRETRASAGLRRALFFSAGTVAFSSSGSYSLLTLPPLFSLLFPWFICSLFTAQQIHYWCKGIFYASYPSLLPPYTSTDSRLPSGFSFVAGTTASLSAVSWRSCSVGPGGLSLLCCRCLQSSLCVSSSGGTWWATSAVGGKTW